MPRAPNSWTYFSDYSFCLLLEEIGQAKLARILGVTQRTVHDWWNLKSIPSEGHQIVMQTLLDGKLDPEDLGTRLQQYMYAHRIKKKDLAEVLKVSESTLQGWFTGYRVPRNSSAINKLLRTPWKRLHVKQG